MVVLSFILVLASVFKLSAYIGIMPLNQKFFVCKEQIHKGARAVWLVTWRCDTSQRE